MISQFLFNKASENEAKAEVKAAPPVGAELDILK
jgi:hypothetical protein